MFEDFKKKVKTHNDKPSRTLKTVKLTQEEITEVKQKDRDTVRTCLQ